MLIYYFYKIFKMPDNQKIMILGLIAEIVICFVFIFLVSFFLALFLILVSFTALSFFLIHIKNQKVSVIYDALYYLSLTILLVLSIFNQNILLYTSLISTLIFFLSETNQSYIRKSYEESANEYQNKIIQKQVDEVQNIYMTMRGWRHDYHNHLQNLKAHLSMKQYDKASNYLDELEQDLRNVNQLVESGNINLDAILNSKLSLATKRDIDINFKASVPSTLTVSDIDLCVLIGNLIDNAVEACEKMVSNKKFIRLYIGVLKKQLYISISNSTAEVVRKLDEEYITTKRGNHGHGLKRINNIINKYHGYINRKNEPGIFATEIMLPL